MKYLPLVWAGIWRKAIAAARADLLIVHRRLSWDEPLPVGSSSARDLIR